MAAATGATGVRAWLQAQHVSWLTPRVLRGITIALFVVAIGFSSVTISGSTPAAHSHHTAAVSDNR